VGWISQRQCLPKVEREGYALLRRYRKGRHSLLLAAFFSSWLSLLLEECHRDQSLRISLDQRQNYGEERWVGLGMLDGRVVVVVFTEPDRETVRIISLRKALPYERKRYEQYLKNELGEG
jgi:uncharacterized DUF497 family protein